MKELTISQKLSNGDLNEKLLNCFQAARKRYAFERNIEIAGWYAYSKLTPKLMNEGWCADDIIDELVTNNEFLNQDLFRQKEEIDELYKILVKDFGAEKAKEYFVNALSSIEYDVYVAKIHPDVTYKEVTLRNYESNKKTFLIPNIDDVILMIVTIISGDEVLNVHYKNDKTLVLDSDDKKSLNLFDGYYILSVKDLEDFSNAATVEDNVKKFKK